MKLEFIPFENIDKRKWNGTIYTAPNGNISGYYWFLKSVLKEWDAIIEGDYQSVMPVFRYAPSPFQLDLLYELGPYTVNAFTSGRILAFFEAWKEKTGAISYPFNDVATRLLLEKNEDAIQSENRYFLDLSDSYERLATQYHPEVKEILEQIQPSDYMFHAQEKPEEILSEEGLGKEETNILYRLMYNAIQRGCGWHAKVSKVGSNNDAANFYISDQRSIRMIYALKKNDPTCWAMLQDTFLKSNAGRPIRLFMPVGVKPVFGESALNLASFKGTEGNISPADKHQKLFSAAFWQEIFRRF